METVRYLCLYNFLVPASHSFWILRFLAFIWCMMPLSLPPVGVHPKIWSFAAPLCVLTSLQSPNNEWPCRLAKWRTHNWSVPHNNLCFGDASSRWPWRLVFFRRVWMAIWLPLNVHTFLKVDCILYLTACIWAIKLFYETHSIQCQVTKWWKLIKYYNLFPW